jgi:hypothetical protein
VLALSGDLDASGAIAVTAPVLLSLAADIQANNDLIAVLPTALTVAADVNAPGDLQAAATLVLSAAFGLVDANATAVAAAIELIVEALDRRIEVGPLDTDIVTLLDSRYISKTRH